MAQFKHTLVDTHSCTKASLHTAADLNASTLSQADTYCGHMLISIMTGSHTTYATDTTPLDAGEMQGLMGHTIVIICTLVASVLSDSTGPNTPDGLMMTRSMPSSFATFQCLLLCLHLRVKQCGGASDYCFLHGLCRAWEGFPPAFVNFRHDALLSLRQVLDVISVLKHD